MHLYLNALSGISDKFSSTHSCYICDGRKDPITQRWIKGVYRTWLSGMIDHTAFMERGGDPKYQSEFNNQLRDPILLVTNPRTPYYKKIRPDPLHCIKLGYTY